MSLCFGLDSFGIAATFLMYAGICLLAVLFIFVFVPETKNRTLEQITHQLHSGYGCSNPNQLQFVNNFPFFIDLLLRVA
jgi:hypothetical protein